MMRLSLLPSPRARPPGAAASSPAPPARRAPLVPAVLAALALAAVATAVALGTMSPPRTTGEGAFAAPPPSYPGAAPDPHTVVLRADGTLSVWEPGRAR